MNPITLGEKKTSEVRIQVFSSKFKAMCEWNHIIPATIKLYIHTLSELPTCRIKTFVALLHFLSVSLHFLIMCLHILANCATVTKNVPIILSVSTFTVSQIIPTVYLLHSVHPSYRATRLLIRLHLTRKPFRSSIQNDWCHLRNTPLYRGNKLGVDLLF